MSLKIPLGGCAHSLHQCWTHPTVNWPSSNWTDFVSKLRSNRVSFNMFSLICTNMHEFIKYQRLIVEHVQTFHCKNIDMLALLSHHHHHHRHHHHHHHHHHHKWHWDLPGAIIPSPGAAVFICNWQYCLEVCTHHKVEKIYCAKYILAFWKLSTYEKLSKYKKILKILWSRFFARPNSCRI